MSNDRVKVTEAAAILGVSPQYIRIGIQNGDLEIGSAVKMSSIWTYQISVGQLAEYCRRDIQYIQDELEKLREGNKCLASIKK